MNKQDDFLTYSKSHKKISYPASLGMDDFLHLEEFDNLLLKVWKQEGFNGYDEGLWWLTPPGLLASIAHAWKLKSKGIYIIGRTAFGDLFINSKKNKITVLNTRIQETILFEEDIDFFFNVLLMNSDFKKDILDEDLFLEAQKKLTPIDFDEVYGVFPPPALGGNFSIESLKKVKLNEYLIFLSQQMV